MGKTFKTPPKQLEDQRRYRARLKESGRAKKAVTVWFTTDELEDLDTERGEESRNAFIRRNILGVDLPNWS